MVRATASTASRKRIPPQATAPRTRPVRILVAMPRALLRELLVLRLENETGLQLVGCVHDASELVRTAKRHSPRVLLLDTTVQREGAGRMVLGLRASFRGMRILLLSSQPSDDDLQRALRCGASGIVPTQCDYAMLLRAIHAVARGELWANRRATARALERSFDPVTASEPLGARLTGKERQIVDEVGRGLRNKEIARRLGISEKTVKNHLSSIFRKLNVDNRFAVGLYSRDLGLTS